MHCCSLFNKKFPHGDLGGNRYTLKGKYANLHLLWDSGAGAFSENRYLENSFDSKPIAKELMQKYPRKNFSKIHSPEQWAEESHKLAVTVAYQVKEGSTPSEEYLEKVREVSKSQAALAGYRLAEILNSIPLYAHNALP
ncbi:MAG: hypothetical protein K940chlam6_00745 [Chlamydiae bacterium]|nr:hypothetical protein [Chlamydiota bacterium]